MGKRRAIRPTRRQKEIMRLNKLLPDNWFVIGEHEGRLYLVNKNSSRKRQLVIEGYE